MESRAYCSKHIWTRKRHYVKRRVFTWH